MLRLVLCLGSSEVEGVLLSTAFACEFAGGEGGQLQVYGFKEATNLSLLDSFETFDFEICLVRSPILRNAFLVKAIGIFETDTSENLGSLNLIVTLVFLFAPIVEFVDMRGYYKCFGRKKRNGCDKKTVQKKALEDIVINATLKHILNSEVIDGIVDQLLKIQNEQRDTAELTLLRKELHQVESYIKNLLTAIKKGIITDSTQEELQKLEEEKKVLEEKIVKAEYDTNSYLTRERIEFWFEQFAAFNIEDEGARQYLITYFINKIILYDDKVIIIYNHDGDNRTELGIDEIEEAFGSDLTQLPPPKERHTYMVCFFVQKAPNCSKENLFILFVEKIVQNVCNVQAGVIK